MAQIRIFYGNNLGIVERDVNEFLLNIPEHKLRHVTVSEFSQGFSCVVLYQL